MAWRAAADRADRNPPVSNTRASERDLIALMGSCARDPLRFVRVAFPWGEAGTELEKFTGPRTWQAEQLGGIGARLREVAAQKKIAPGLAVPLVIQEATASGHGIGKSAEVAWIILWAMSTFPGCKGIVTANTEKQLSTKTWPELAKWHRMAINSHWFTIAATSLTSADPAHEKTWRMDAIPWSENNTEAFAGMHNQGRRVLMVFDEASAISDTIWEVAEGAMTDDDTELLWLAYGNPTRNTGRFRECFSRLAHRWHTKQIDSRTVEGTNKEQLNAWCEDYGDDSDFVRVRVKGEFPRAGTLQLIAGDDVDRAMAAEATALMTDSLVMGADIARFGDDSTVIRFRRGRDGRTIKPVKLRGADTMEVAGRIAALNEQWSPDAIFIDEGGVGGGVVDRLRQLGVKVIGVNFGAKADGPVDEMLCANKRAEMWVKMRRWLRDGAAIDNDRDLCEGMTAVEYGYNKQQAIVLEAKESMKRRGLPSPDDADALALTFAYPVSQRSGPAGAKKKPAMAVMDYDPLGYGG
jgi:hypothetical protein